MVRHSWCLTLWINKCLLRDITWFISYLLFSSFFLRILLTFLFFLCLCVFGCDFHSTNVYGVESIRSACGSDIDKAMCYYFSTHLFHLKHNAKIIWREWEESVCVGEDETKIHVSSSLRPIKKIGNYFFIAIVHKGKKLCQKKK